MTKTVPVVPLPNLYPLTMPNIIDRNNLVPTIKNHGFQNNRQIINQIIDIRVMFVISGVQILKHRSERNDDRSDFKIVVVLFMIG